MARVLGPFLCNKTKVLTSCNGVKAPCRCSCWSNRSSKTSAHLLLNLPRTPLVRNQKLCILVPPLLRCPSTIWNLPAANHGEASASTPEIQSEKNPLGAKTAETNQKNLQTSVSKSDANKTKSFPKSAKTRDAGGHAVADDGIARCEELATAFYANPRDMDAFIDQILLVPQQQAYDLFCVTKPRC